LTDVTKLNVYVHFCAAMTLMKATYSVAYFRRRNIGCSLSLM